MPAKWFICPDGQQIEIAECLLRGGCRMGFRCATLPFLRAISFDREWRGVTPSAAGNGARYLWLKATCDYAINPQDRVWAILGTGTHDKLALDKYAFNVLAEEKLSNEQMQGVADLLEEDEEQNGYYILSDYKTWGSFKVAKARGIVKKQSPILDDEGKPVLLKSGKNKGQPKTKTEIIVDPEKEDLENEELQLNRYRIFFEDKGFPISRMQIQAIPRDGNTYIAQSRGIERNIYVIPIKRLPDEYVIEFYNCLQDKVLEAFEKGWIEKCNAKESWEGRRCEGYCEVEKYCNELDKKGGK